MKRLILIDSNSLLNKAFYAIRTPLTTEDGVPTNAVFGYLNMLIKLIKDYNPSHMIAAFDVKAPTFRKDMYDDYKAQRKPMPEELAAQLPIARELVRKMGVELIECPGFEADDVIGTLAKKCPYNTLIVTGDRDSLQLVSDTTTVLYSKQGITDVIEYTPSRLAEDGFTPSQIIDLKALMGDASDNIPGVPGVGKTTAAKLLGEYGTLDGVYEHIDEIKGKLQEKLIANKELAYLSYRLATIDTDMDIPYNEKEAAFEYPLGDEARDFLESLNFKTALAKLDFTKIVKKTAAETVTISNIASFDTLLDKIAVIGTTAIYIDSSGAYHLAYDGNSDYVINEKVNLLDEAIEFSYIECRITQLMSNPSIRKVIYDAKAFKYNYNEINNYDDIAIKAYLADANKNYKSVDKLLDDYGYADTNACALLAVENIIDKALDNYSLRALYNDVEKPLINVLFKMEKSGIGVDIDVLRELQSKFADELASVTKKIIELAGENFNINSTQQLSRILFDVLGLKHGKKNKSGMYSTNIDVLESLKGEHPIIEYLLRYRELSKLLSTYINGLEPLLKDGKLHGVFNQTVTATGRLSSSEPNLQNIPVRKPEGREIRRMFVPDKGNVLISADYSQIELRLLAHLSGDAGLIAAFKNGDDIHTSTAAKVFGVALDNVSSAMRSRAKAVNFGIIYGISDYGLSEDIGSSVAEARAFIAKYFETYPQVKNYLDGAKEFARENKYQTTIFGRIRKLPDINTKNYNVRSFNERVAMNMPMQGSASDIIKIAMLKVDKALENRGLNAKLILQVHDELIIDCPNEEKDEVSALLRDAMENAVELQVPLTVDINMGNNWYEAK